MLFTVGKSRLMRVRVAKLYCIATNLCYMSTTTTRPTPNHSQAMTSAAQAVPHHTLQESPNSRSIEINDWLITASTNPISNSGECDALQSKLGFPLPEMPFGNNYLSLEHRSSGWKYAFSTSEALQCVKNGELTAGDGGVKVGYADAWLKSR